MEHHSFEILPALVSSAVVLAALAFGYLLFFEGRLPRGVTGRNPVARAGYRLLVNKYYLDHLYTGIVIGSIKGAIARAAYWVNQKVIDGVVNGVGVASKWSGNWVYKYLDQKGVDRVVNGAGFGAEGFGGILRTIQTGRVQQYGALLFGATAVLALSLVIFI